MCEHLRMEETVPNAPKKKTPIQEVTELISSLRWLADCIHNAYQMELNSELLCLLR